MIYEVGKVATSVTSLNANHLSGNIFGNRVATTGYIIGNQVVKWEQGCRDLSGDLLFSITKFECN
jgi:hypothetical protein